MSNSTEDLLQQLLSTVNALKKDVDDLKAAKADDHDEGTKPPAPKHHRNGDSEVSHDGDDPTRDRDGDL